MIPNFRGESLTRLHSRPPRHLVRIGRCGHHMDGGSMQESMSVGVKASRRGGSEIRLNGTPDSLRSYIAYLLLTIKPINGIGIIDQI